MGEKIPWLWEPFFPEWWRWKFRKIDGETNWPYLGVVLCRIRGHGELSQEVDGGHDGPPEYYTYCLRCGDSW